MNDLNGKENHHNFYDDDNSEQKTFYSLDEPLQLSNKPIDCNPFRVACFCVYSVTDVNVNPFSAN